MSCRDFDNEYCINKKSLYAVICVYHPLVYTEQKFINRMLETVQTQLKNELSDYEDIQVAYVYETPLLCVKNFETLKQDTQIYYKEPCIGEGHNLAHVMFMGLTLLQNLQNQDVNGEYRLYLLTEDKFERSHVNQIVYKKSGSIDIHSVFNKLIYKPILLKTENAGGDILEEYFRTKGEISLVFEYKEINSKNNTGDIND